MPQFFFCTSNFQTPCILKIVENDTKQSGLDCLSFFLDFVSAMPSKVNAPTR
jgi:hypothetical protein